MPGSYSTDLRERVLVAVEAPETVAERFKVGRATVYRWVVAARHEGRRTAKPMIHGAVKVALRRLLEENNPLTLAECRDRVAEETGIRVHPWTVGRTLRRLDWMWKKSSVRAAEQHREDVVQACATWQTDTVGVSGIVPQHLVFLDECGALTNMARR